MTNSQVSKCITLHITSVFLSSR